MKTLLKFEKLLKDYNLIYRDLGSIHNPATYDNDVEHSYRVAMLCWMIIDEYGFTDLDTNKVIRYALVHDLAEVYAGDFSIYSNYSPATKQAAEAKSVKKLSKQFPKQKSMWHDLEMYEKKEDPESRFVYIIEKLEPVLVVALSELDHFSKRKVNVFELIDKKNRKIAGYESDALRFHNDVMTYLKRNSTKLNNGGSTQSAQ